MKNKKIKRLELKLKFKISKKYNKVKYLLRIKHFRGRDIHSPFMYGVARKALMNKRGKQMVLNNSLYAFLDANKYAESSKLRICRIFAYLEFDNFSTLDAYNDTNSLLIIEPSQSFDELTEAINKIKKTTNLVCITLRAIYSDPASHALWKQITTHADCVTVDLFYEGVIFINENLIKQNYKMKF